MGLWAGAQSMLMPAAAAKARVKLSEADPPNTETAGLLLPRMSRNSTIMELGPKNHNIRLFSLKSRMGQYLDLLG